MTDHITLGIIFFTVVMLAFYIVSTFNDFVNRRNRVNTQWAQIDIQLMRRADLIPNLVETVKGYASHEKEIFENFASARSALNSASSPEQAIAANDYLSGQLSRLFAVSEAYPDLKADSNFISLQASLKETEDKIAYARQFYNDAVLLYNDKIHKFPSNIIAKIFNFKEKSFYTVCENKKKEVAINFQ